ncbi:hypothetical protein K1T71_013550 [Dendrolimus kikuchii]|uniref:Uncharacterized protein n=1 Tax=Dendrolimus kikuchii TaxID=765133 RepID=A0ACC1CGR9_9NEOP|nr:hypothetical protein K1T71_013550 [Dendrolimus kikuchii]
MFWIRRILLWIWIAILMINGIPKCTNHSDEEVACFAGTTDHKLERGLVSDNNRTTSIILRNCRISEVDYEAFENLFNLRRLDLSHNKIITFKLGVLDGFTNLIYLNMSYNYITGFPLGLFDQKPNLEILDLKGNEITSLELGIFDLMKKLKYVDLSSNKLLGHNFDPYLFDQSPYITFMDFSRNNMTEAKNNILHAFQSIQFLNLDRCSLNAVPSFAISYNLKTMIHLMLSSNQISELPENTFIQLDNLEILNVAHNVIKRIENRVLQPLKKLKMIVLRHNLLNNIPENLFTDMKNLGNIDLSYNKLEYVTVNAFRGTALKNLNLAGNQLTFLTSNFCLELRNSGVFLAKFYFNQNPWQCWCLHEVLKEVNKYGIKYNREQYNGQVPVCVTSNQFTCIRDMNLVGNYAIQYRNLILHRSD